MSQSRTKAAPVSETESRSVLKAEFLTLMGTIIGIGIALGALVLTTTGRIETRLDNAISEAAADRRAGDEKMAEFGRRMDEARRAEDAKMEEFRRRMGEARRAEDAKMEEFRRRMGEARRAEDAKMEEFRRRMDENHRASESKMDEFRGQMRHLGERQARLEGQREAGATE